MWHAVNTNGLTMNELHNVRRSDVDFKRCIVEIHSFNSILFTIFVHAHAQGTWNESPLFSDSHRRVLLRAARHIWFPFRFGHSEKRGGAVAVVCCTWMHVCRTAYPSGCGLLFSCLVSHLANAPLFQLRVQRTNGKAMQMTNWMNVAALFASTEHVSSCSYAQKQSTHCSIVTKRETVANEEIRSACEVSIYIAPPKTCTSMKFHVRCVLQLILFRFLFSSSSKRWNWRNAPRTAHTHTHNSSLKRVCTCSEPTSTKLFKLFFEIGKKMREIYTTCFVVRVDWKRIAV